MVNERISSRQNSAVRHARAVRDGKDDAYLFIEGVRLCEAAAAAIEIETVFYTDTVERDERASRLLAMLDEKGARLVSVTSSVFDSISDTKTPQGLIALARRPATNRDAFKPRSGVSLIVLLHRINNPSNAGAALRVAEAAGVKGVISTAGSTDLLSPKSLRGSMGSAFRMPLWEGASLGDALEWCAQRKIRTVATSTDATLEYTDIDWTLPRAVFLGPEATGLDADELALADERVRIPMSGTVESLNLSVALGVVLYEAARQRRFRFAVES